MHGPNETPFLAKLAEIFRQEGDTATADALGRQLRSTASRIMKPGEMARVRRLRNNAVRLDNLGAHDEAEPIFIELLGIVEAALDPDHPDIADSLNDLARCRLNKGDHKAALEDYSRLLRIMKRAHGPDDMLTRITRDSVERCHKSLRDAIGAQRLQTQMTWMLRQAQGARSVEVDNDQERLRDLARRLMARGRLAASTHMYERWIDWRLRDTRPDDELALLDIRDYAMALRDAGQWGRAASVLWKLVALRNRQSAGAEDKSALLQALADWQACLAAMGDQRSASEAAALADSIANRRFQDGPPEEE